MGDPGGEGAIRPIAPMLWVFTKTYERVGSKETPPQLPPPIAPGKVRTGSKPNGVYRLPWMYLSNCSAQYFSAWGVRLLNSSRVIAVARARGGGFIGKGCVGQDSSPGTWLFRTGRSSPPHTGLPVSRSRIKSKPIFVISAIAGISLSSFLAVTRVGEPVTS